MISAKISKEKRKEIYRRDGFRCALCDSGRYLQIHHVVPRSRGGSDSEYNLITLCSTCHAQCHGVDMYNSGLARNILAESMECDCVEYLSEYYASISPRRLDEYLADRFANLRRCGRFDE